MTTQCAIPGCNHPDSPCTGACTTKIQEWREQARSGADTPLPTIDATLIERGHRYGKFTGHAAVTQAIKSVMFNTRPDLELAADQREALEMIAHKIGRIVNGDPDYADSWVDIAGYAKLVADRLNGVAK